MQKSRDQALRAGRIIARIRSFIRSRRPEPSRFDINELLLESIELLEVARDEHAIRTELRLTPDPLIAHADRTLMAQVIHNLLQNAIDAMQTIPDDQRRLTITTDRAPDGAIVLTFADNGPGIPDYLAESAYCPVLDQGEGPRPRFIDLPFGHRSTRRTHLARNRTDRRLRLSHHAAGGNR